VKCMFVIDASLEVYILNVEKVMPRQSDLVSASILCRPINTATHEDTKKALL
jgi:hypothetical protein